jgi:hypothetical protein
VDIVAWRATIATKTTMMNVGQYMVSVDASKILEA